MRGVGIEKAISPPGSTNQIEPRPETFASSSGLVSIVHASVSAAAGGAESVRFSLRPETVDRYSALIPGSTLSSTASLESSPLAGPPFPPVIRSSSQAPSDSTRTGFDAASSGSRIRNGAAWFSNAYPASFEETRSTSIDCQLPSASLKLTGPG